MYKYRKQDIKKSGTIKYFYDNYKNYILKYMLEKVHIW
jgi:hypothetical protein